MNRHDEATVQSRCYILYHAGEAIVSFSYSFCLCIDAVLEVWKYLIYILKQKSLATQNLVGILFIMKIPVLKMD